jgi:hypothetical protein
VLYGSPPVLAPAGSDLTASQLSGLASSLQAGNLTSLLNLGGLSTNASFLQGVFNESIFSTFGLGGEYNSTLAEIGGYSSGTNSTLGTIGGFVNGTGVNGNSSLSGIIGKLGSPVLAVGPACVGGGMIAVIVAKTARKRGVIEP